MKGPLALCISLLALSPTPVAAQACTPLQLSHRLILVPVMLNGKGPFKFIFDTGAQMTTIDISIAKNLPRVQKVQLLVGGGTDARTVDARALKSLIIGGLTVGPVAVLTFDMQPLKDKSGDIPEVVRILGADVIGKAGALSVGYHKQCITIQ